MRRISIADVLFSTTQQRLLAALLLHSHRPVYASELANRFGVRPSTLQRDLAKYTAAGLLKMSRSGNRTYFQANQECPVFPELRALLIKTSGLVDVLRGELAPLSSQIKVAAVYGSIANGTETSGSDIDFLIIGAVAMIELSSLLEKATEKLWRQINPTLYTPEEFSQKSRSSHFVQSVLGKPLLFVLGMESDLEAITGRKSRGGGASKPKEPSRPLTDFLF
ncbi:MAG: nucleotidyltransferase domain-containing protein [Limisphaerales bacterium]